jgi:hypothetical protein
MQQTTLSNVHVDADTVMFNSAHNVHASHFVGLVILVYM